MLEDILYDSNVFILEQSAGIIGGEISSYSMDGDSYDFNQVETETESSFVFVN